MSDGPVLLVTGGTRGIGAAIAAIASKRGYRVAVCGKSDQALDGIAACEAQANGLRVYRCDVRNSEQQAHMVQSVVEDFGRIDAAVLSAGVNAPRGFNVSRFSDWKNVLDTNVLASAVTASLVLPHLKESKYSGQLVFLGSVTGDRVAPGSIYSVSKAAVAALSETVLREVREEGDTALRVCLLELGWVDTEFLSTPRSAPLQPDEVAEAVMFILSRPRNVEVRRLTLAPTHQTDF